MAGRQAEARAQIDVAVEFQTIAFALLGVDQGCTVTDPIVNVAGQNRAKIDGNPFPQAPEYTANLTLNYVRALGNDTELFASTDWVMQKDSACAQAAFEAGVHLELNRVVQEQVEVLLHDPVGRGGLHGH